MTLGATAVFGLSTRYPQGEPGLTRRCWRRCQRGLRQGRPDRGGSRRPTDQLSPGNAMPGLERLGPLWYEVTAGARAAGRAGICR